MKNLLIIIFSILFLSSYCQKWQKTFGQPSLYESPRDISISYDNGYLIIGNTGADDRGWLIKTDINGEMLWDLYFEASGLDPILMSAEQDEYGNIFIAGLAKWGEETPASLVFKLNFCGDLLWCKTLYTENYDYCRIRELQIINDTTLICYARHNEPENETNNYLYNIDPENGHVRWKKGYASKVNYPLIDQSNCVRLYSYNDWFLLAGDCYSAYPNGDSNHFYLHPFYIGIDTDFKEKWVLTFGVSDSLLGLAWGAIPVSDSIIMGFGKRRIGSISDPLLMFFDIEGNELGYNIIDNDLIAPDIKINQICDMRRINDTLLFASLAFSVDEIDMNFCDIHTDTSANVHKVKMVDSNAGGGGISNMIKTFDNKYVVTTGYIENGLGDIYLYKKNGDLEHDTLYPGYYAYDSLCDEQIVSSTIDLGGCEIIVDIKEVPTLEEYMENRSKIHITAIPNPATKGEVTLQFENTDIFNKLELKCYNVFGKLVHQEKVYRNQGETSLNIEGWERGIYFAIVYTNNRIIGQTKFVIQ